MKVSVFRGMLGAAALLAALSAGAQAQSMAVGQDPAAPAAQVLPVPVPGLADAAASVGAIGAVGPGDTLAISVFGQPGMDARVTVDAEGRVTVPMLGNIDVGGLAPSAIGKRIEDGLRSQGYVRDPQVGVEVLAVRSRVVSVLGAVERPGRYPIESTLSVLELLAMAGGAADGAADTAVLLRRGGADGGQQRIDLYVGGGQSPSRAIQDTELRAGDVVFLPRAARFYVYGEVRTPGAYPVEDGLNVMRALALAGGLTPRASESRIDIKRADPAGGEVATLRAKPADSVQPGDVVYVGERIF